MGGAVAKVSKAVVKPFQEVGEKVGIIKEKQGATPLAELAKTAVSKAEASPAAAMREEMMARRRARRGGRALLSEARLTPESGVGGQTLGSGPST
jgi:hypothetical protein